MESPECGSVFYSRFPILHKPAIPIFYLSGTPTTLISKFVITMTEKTGHFEKGFWVEEPIIPEKSPEKKDDQIDVRLAAATRSVMSAMDDLAKATHDLVATEEGKKHIEKTVKETTVQVQKSFDDIIRRAKAEVDKATKPKK